MFSVIAHEIAHGYAALKQGDDTAQSLGRLTLNPLRHIDPFLTILLPLVLWVSSPVVLGGAKPVPVDPRKYKHLVRGDIIVSLAGVATNVVLAAIFVPLVALMGVLGRALPGLEPSFGLLQAMFVFGIELNLILAAFNLIPIPPLDGSHVLKYLLPPSLSLWYQRVGRFGLVVLIAVLWLAPNALGHWLSPVDHLTNALANLVSGTFLPSATPWIQGGGA